MKKLTTDEVEERDELAAAVAELFMSGFLPNETQVQRASALGLDLNAIREAVDACYEPEGAEA